MKRFLLGLLLLCCSASLLTAQSDNVVYVKQFPGGDVGTKVTNAMASCNPSTSIPCLLVVDPSLASYAAGTMPSMCSHCYLQDFRTGPAPANNLTYAPNALNYPGATPDQQINACLAANPICDARAFGATSPVLSATVEVGVGGAEKMLILDPSTTFQPLNSSTPAVMFKVDPNGQLWHGRVLMPSSIVYTGKVLDVETTPINSQNAFMVDDFLVDASAESGFGQAGGYCVFVGANSSFIQFAHFHKVRCDGLEYGLYLYATGSTGYINGNSFDSFTFNHSKYMLSLDTTGGPGGCSGYGINGNNFPNLKMEGGNSTGAIQYLGSTCEVGNTYSPAKIWDITTPILNSNPNAESNIFVGSMDFIPTVANDPAMGISFGNFRNKYYLAGTSVGTGDYGVLDINAIQNGPEIVGSPAALGGSFRLSGALGYNLFGNDEVDIPNNAENSASGPCWSLPDNFSNTGTYHDVFDVNCEGDLVPHAHLDQSSTGNVGGACSMSSSTSCTFSLGLAFIGTPVCIATVQNATVIAGSCTVSGTTVTIHAASSNSSSWGAVLIGNPN